MPRIAPFTALVYDTDVAGPLEGLTARPYDVINEAGRQDYVARSPYNVVRVDLASDPLAPPAARYAASQQVLRDWTSTGVLRREPLGYVAYEMSTSGPGAVPAVRGVLCALHLEAWGGAILPHEDVMDGPVADRLELLRATRTNLSAIYGTVPGPHAELADLLSGICATPAQGEVTDQEGVRHRTWPIPPDTPVSTWLADDHLLIADGHHRYTTALAYRDERHRADGPGPWDRVLALVVDAGTQDVPVLPYHRVQRTGMALGGGTLVDDLATLFAGLDDVAVRIGSVTRGPAGELRWRLHDLHGDPPAVRALHEAHLDAAAPAQASSFTHVAADAVEAVRSGEVVGA
ncbi:MAG: DUF1015 domain-containing protein, partial [Actinomycetota bacterium]